MNCIKKQHVQINYIKNMFRNSDTIYFLARSSKNFSTKINFSENIFWVYRGLLGGSFIRPFKAL